MAEVNYGSLPHAEAIKYFKEKLLIPSEKWDDLTGSIHAKAFTIAGATNLELLSDFHKTIRSYIESGDSLASFRSDFDEIVKKHGWSYNGSKGWRSRVIFQTNKRSAYMAGKWEQLQRVKKRRPYLIYMTVDDSRVREDHKKWHMLALHIDDPFWHTHYPPNGWLCRCYVRSASKRDLARLGLKVGEPQEIELVDHIDPKTGEVTQKYPGIDIGWDYNVGKAWLAPEVILGQQLMELPKSLREPAINWFKNDVFDQPFEKMVNSVASSMVKKERIGAGLAQTVGYIDNNVVDALISAEQIPIGAAIVVRDSDIVHWLRDSKSDRNAALPLSIASKVPSIIREPDVILFDKKDKKITYARKLADGRYAKLVLKLNFKTRLNHNKSRFKEYLNYIVTAGVVKAHNLKEPKYEVIAGAIE